MCYCRLFSAAQTLPTHVVTSGCLLFTTDRVAGLVETFFFSYVTSQYEKKIVFGVNMDPAGQNRKLKKSAFPVLE